MNTSTRPSSWLAGVVVAGLLLTCAAPAMADTVLAAQVDEPRAYGWRVGDVVRRVVHVQLPPGWQLDERSLPKPDQRGGELELRALRLLVDDQPPSIDGDSGESVVSATALVAGGVLSGSDAEHDEIGTSPQRGVVASLPETLATGWRGALVQGWAGSARALAQRLVSALRWTGPGADGAVAAPAAAATRQALRQRLELDYQLFAATGTARPLELPTLTLLVEPPAGLAGATPRELRLPARPLWLVSLAGGAPGHQNGLGEMRPDVAVQGVATAAPARQLVASLVVAVALLLLVAGAGVLLRWLGVTARTRPFRQASRDIRRLLARRSGAAAAPLVDAEAEAWRVLHQAFDHSAGRTLLPRQARAWALADTRYIGQADEITRFFDASAERFFAIGVVAPRAGPTRGATAGPRVGQPVDSPTGPVTGGPASPVVPVMRPGKLAVTAAANDDHGFDQARLLRLASALARAEAAGLASQGVRRVTDPWWRRRAMARTAGLGADAVAGSTGGAGGAGAWAATRAGAGAGAQRPGVGTDG